MLAALFCRSQSRRAPVPLVAGPCTLKEAFTALWSCWFELLYVQVFSHFGIELVRFSVLPGAWCEAGHM